VRSKTTNQIQSQVFLSYGQDNQDFVETLAQRLQGDTRFSFWFGPWHSTPGPADPRAMEVSPLAARNCAAFIGTGQIKCWQEE
jgi:hypothetical protein